MSIVALLKVCGQPANHINSIATKQIISAIVTPRLGLRSRHTIQKNSGLAHNRLKFHLVHQWSLPNQR